MINHLHIIQPSMVIHVLQLDKISRKIQSGEIKYDQLDIDPETTEEMVEAKEWPGTELLLTTGAKLIYSGANWYLSGYREDGSDVTPYLELLKAEALETISA